MEMCNTHLSSLITRRRRPSGFTLVEILTALFVLVIGITGTLAIIMRSAQMSTSAADRNNASVLIPEAIDDIKRMMQLPNDPTNPFYTLPGNASLAVHAGELMDTVNLTSTGNPYANVNLPYLPPGKAAPLYVPFKNLTYPLVSHDQSTGHDLSLVYWPLNPGFARVMGQQLTTAGPQTLGTNGVMYRALFKLEPHSDWVPDPFNRSATRENAGSEFVGVYVLTITMYRFTDPEPRLPLSDKSANQKKLTQITDPVVVYLHDTKVRQ
jgi:prepilin-type N-terminal cleavage/methylation domain-containing protein